MMSTIRNIARTGALAALVAAPIAALAWNPRVPLDPVPCALFPPDNVWNADIAGLPAHARSTDWVA
jgi:hypothetical protein